ncbi:hypothetical protein CALCODRAFT_493138 [Calocera cornea HHB12733]|uniref:Uncharacterized protein n=1 Tax=Calocera cornea HHB12733 TaxID=1353952 RepID=A0A165HXL9_9BASI|nr:hypothetical protein CALCODRAFT_493138 [Calocera cornea HHB12733]
MRQALTAQQLSAKKAKANYHATVAKAKTDAKLHLRPAVRPDENARPVPSPTPLRGKERTPLAVVDMAGPRTRSSGRKAAAAATGQAASFVLAPEPKAALKAPAKPLGLKRKHVEDPTPAVADERPAKKSRGKPKAATTEIRRKATGSKEVLFAQLAVGRARQEGLEPPADALKIVESRRHLGPILSGPGPARAAASAVASVQPAVIPMEEGVPTPAVPTATQTHVSQMDESPTHPAVQHASPKQEAPAVKTRAKRAKKALELPARGSTLNRGTARILLTQLQVQQATTDAERTAANTELAEATAPKIVSQTRYALRERRTLASTPKSQDMTHHSVVEDQRRCRGCKHLFSTTQGLARHKQGKRTRPDCRA